MNEGKRIGMRVGSLGAVFALAACIVVPAEPEKPAPVVIIKDGPGCHPLPKSPPSYVGRAAGVEYHERLYGGARAHDLLPMIVSLHGMGDQPRSLFSEFDLPVRVISPRAPLEYGEGYAWYLHRTQGKNLTAFTQGVRTAAQHMAAVLDELVATRPTIGKPIVTGMSQGGILTFALALHYPDKLQAAYPVAGWLPQALWPWRRPTVDQPPILALHGGADTIVPAAQDQRLVKHLERRGYPVHLLEYAGVAHEMTPPMHEQRYLALQERIAEIWHQRR